jgi:hypothetical protein
MIGHEVFNFATEYTTSKPNRRNAKRDGKFRLVQMKLPHVAGLAGEEMGVPGLHLLRGDVPLRGLEVDLAPLGVRGRSGVGMETTCGGTLDGGAGVFFAGESGRREHPCHFHIRIDSATGRARLGRLRVRLRSPHRTSNTSSSSTSPACNDAARAVGARSERNEDTVRAASSTNCKGIPCGAQDCASVGTALFYRRELRDARLCNSCVIVSANPAISRLIPVGGTREVPSGTRGK